MKIAKCRLTIPGKLQLLSFAFNKSMKTGIFWRYHYKAIQEIILEDAKNLDVKKGKSIVLKIKDGGVEWKFLVKRKIG